VPRKYRPPAARRRKSKRQPPYFVEPLPESGDEAAAQDGAGPSTLENAEEVAVAVAAPKPGPVQTRAAERPTATTVKHITKDYSYVPAEVRRILLVAGFLIVSLIITALLRN
jgi:hypothetical protein